MHKQVMSSRKGFTIWFTGLSGAGKSTLSHALAAELAKHKVRIEILDGDEVRTNLSKGLGFSKDDRDTNIRRIGYVARLLSRNGAGVIAAAISPYRNVREEVRRSIESEGVSFIEVFANCPISVLSERDVKGLYRKAFAGEIKEFTGVSDPYEEPAHPEVIVDTDRQTIAESVATILSAMRRRGLLDIEPETLPQRFQVEHKDVLGAA